jgi:hypothetical protein
MTPMSAGTEDLTSIERSNTRKDNQMYIPKAVVIGFIAALGWAAGWLMYGALSSTSPATPAAAATATRHAAARPRAAAGAAIAQPARSVARAVNRPAAVRRRAPAASTPTGVVARPAFSHATSRRAGQAWPTAVPINQGTTRSSSVGVTAAAPQSVITPAADSAAAVPTRPSRPSTSPVQYALAASSGSNPVATGAQVHSAIAPTTNQLQAPGQLAVVQQPIRQPRTVVPADSRRVPAGDALGTTPGLPVSSGRVATPGSTFSLTTRPDETNPGILHSTGHVATPGSTFSLTTGPDGSHVADRAGNGHVDAGTPSWEPGVARAGSASYPLAVPSPVLMSPPSAAPAVQQPTNPTYPFPATYPGSYPVTYPTRNAFDAPEVGPLGIRGPASYIEPILSPLPGARSRGIAFSEWESYRTDLAGRNIIATTDDSNVFVNRNGKLNGNTGDTDASGLNVTDARNSVIRGTESADEAPYQTAAAAIVDLASEDPGGGLGSDPDDDADDEDDGDANAPDPGANGPAPPSAMPVSGSDDTGDSETGDTDTTAAADEQTAAGAPAIPAAAPARPKASPATPKASAAAPAAPAPGASAPVLSPTGGDESDDSAPEEFDFPYDEWTRQVRADAATAVHTDEGTTLASGQDAVVVGADGYDDDDNRVVGENIIVTRDDGNVVIGGTGDVNAQIGDSEQGAVIMGVEGVFIQGGGAY